MPTGYTAKLVEEGQEFPDFVLRCARAFGALVSMRDAPLDAPIPEKLNDDVVSGKNFYKESLQNYQEELDKIRCLNEEEIKNYCDDFYKKEKAYLEKEYRKAVAKQARVSEMADKVSAWEPPTENHQGLKDFMLQQLSASDESYSVEYYSEKIKDLENKYKVSRGRIYRDKLNYLEGQVAYYKEKLKEKKVINSSFKNQEWLDQLRESLKDG